MWARINKELADAHFETEKFEEFKASSLKGLDEAMWDLAQSAEFDDILAATVRSTFPAHEHEKFIAHYRGLLRHWVESETGSVLWLFQHFRL